MRALLAEPHDWRSKLPAEYWETLRRLESAEAGLLRSPEANPGPASERVRRLQGQLIEWESRAGSNTDVELPDLLERTRRRLGPDAAFFAFHLASPDSYLWAVSRERFALYRLPARAEIARQVARFTEAVRQGQPGAAAAGAQLFNALFGQVHPVFLKKSRWLLALEAQLFELPFAALVEDTRGARPVFLAERHSLQITSGAGMLAQGGRAVLAGGAFVGVADPIYNLADPRWKGPNAESFPGFFTASASDSQGAGDLHLPRLPASAREVEACAAAWHATRGPILLEGAAASRDRIVSAVNDGPAVVHFATHVLASGRSGTGLIMLSLDQAGRHEAANPADIVTWNLHGALVALSGCSSGAADALPATGLMGLTRACQAAGASAVVASHWPTPDDEGALFRAFYSHLRAAPESGPAVALEHAQIEMLQSGAWRANPLYWAAYFVTGNQP